MLDSVITKVERYARAGGTPKALDFANRSGILFKWNDELDESPGELIEDDYVPPTPPSRPCSQEWRSSSGTPQSRKQSRTTLSPTAAPKTRPPSTPVSYRAPLQEWSGRLIDAHAKQIRYAADDNEDNGIIAVADLPQANRGDGLVIDDDDNTDVEPNNDDPPKDTTATRQASRMTS